VVDDAWTSGSGYFYKVCAVDRHGNESESALLRPSDIPGEQPARPLQPTSLFQNYPNPFASPTHIPFAIDRAGLVELRVYDVAGRLVKELVREEREAGTYVEAWDGRNQAGVKVPSGIYLYRLTAGRFVQTKKMVIVR
jgi:hypothetical protein